MHGCGALKKHLNKNLFSNSCADVCKKVYSSPVPKTKRHRVTKPSSSHRQPLKNPAPAVRTLRSRRQQAQPRSVTGGEAAAPRNESCQTSGALRWAQQLPVSAQKRGTPAPIWGSERCLAQILICKAQPVRSERRGAHSLGDPTSHRQRWLSSTSARHVHDAGRPMCKCKKSQPGPWQQGPNPSASQ